MNERSGVMIRRAIFLGAVSLFFLAVAIGFFYWMIAKDLPKFVSTDEYQPRRVSQIIVHHGTTSTVLGEFYKEKRYVIPYEKIPQLLVQAFISAEDEAFFQHEGVSPSSILRAAIANLKAGHVVQGGSTITQQVAKYLFLTPERNLIRKVREFILAYRIEKYLTKEQILFLYLNQIYLGQGSYGVEAASRTYFRKPVSELKLPEIAMIAGMPKAPTNYNPFVNPAQSKDRQRYVLKRMLETGYITKEQFFQATGEAVQVFYPYNINEKLSPHWVEYLRRYLIEKYGEESLYEKGIQVHINADPAILKSAKSNLQYGLREIDKRRGYRGPIAHLQSPEEIQSKISELKTAFIRKHFQYSWLDPQGELREPEFVLDRDLVNILKNTPDLFQAVVSEVNDSKKEATVQLGVLELTAPLEKMLWARVPHEEGKPPNSPPKNVSQVLKPGDLIWVSIVKPEVPKDPKARKPAAALPQWVAQLEQITEVQGAIFSFSAIDGSVLAMEGGYSFENSEFNRATQAQRQTGSAFKPITYSAGIENGYTAATLLSDAPIVYKDEEFGKWKPSNYSDKFEGDLTLFQAFIRSLNTPTVRLVQDLGLKKVIDYAKRLGFTGTLAEDFTIALGTGTTPLSDLTRLYGVFARYGRRAETHFYRKVTTFDGTVLEEIAEQRMIKPSQIRIPVIEKPDEAAKASGETTTLPTQASAQPASQPLVALPQYPPPEDPDQLLDPRVAYVMINLMREVITSGTGASAKELARPASGKTGTTNDFKDAWFIGFTPEIVTGVWVGFDDQRSLGSGESGAHAALPIWLEFMKTATEKLPASEFEIPQGVTFATIHKDTGKLVDEKNPKGVRVAFLTGSEPTEKSGAASNFVESESEFFKEDFH